VLDFEGRTPHPAVSAAVLSGHDEHVRAVAQVARSERARSEPEPVPTSHPALLAAVEHRPVLVCAAGEGIPEPLVGGNGPPNVPGDAGREHDATGGVLDSRAPRNTVRGSPKPPRIGCGRSNGTTGQPYPPEQPAPIERA
jgi:hypothetical protein